MKKYDTEAEMRKSGSRPNSRAGHFEDGKKATEYGNTLRHVIKMMDSKVAFKSNPELKGEQISILSDILSSASHRPSSNMELTKKQMNQTAKKLSNLALLKSSRKIQEELV